jgi:hypothetical protein
MVYAVDTNEATMTNPQLYNCFIRNGGNAISNMPVQMLKGANLPMDLPY